MKIFFAHLFIYNFIPVISVQNDDSLREAIFKLIGCESFKEGIYLRHCMSQWDQGSLMLFQSVIQAFLKGELQEKDFALSLLNRIESKYSKSLSGLATTTRFQ